MVKKRGENYLALSAVIRENEVKMQVLVVAAVKDGKLEPAVLNTITAAAVLGEVDLLLAGDKVTALAATAAQIKGIRTVLVSEAPHFARQLAEELAVLIQKTAAPYQYIIAAATSFGKDLMPRVAALLDCAQVSEVTQIVDKHTFIHPIYAGNALEQVRFREDKGVLTVRTTQFAAAATGSCRAEIKKLTATAPQGGSRFIKKPENQSERPELTQAEVVVAGGRGLGSRENFAALINPLADILGAAVGATRAAVDADYAPNDYQVGQTGKVVAPKLYLALGISGALQHVAGMQDSGTIIAINKDPEAPIFQLADYGLVADINTAVPELIAALKG